MQTGEETFFKIKKTTRMEKVFTAYAGRRGVAVGSLRFLLDGEKIGIDQTPKMLELEDQDQIDCMLEQVRVFVFLLWSVAARSGRQVPHAPPFFRGRRPADWWILIDDDDLGKVPAERPHETFP
jgi:hypothetical protein